MFFKVIVPAGEKKTGERCGRVNNNKVYRTTEWPSRSLAVAAAVEEMKSAQLCGVGWVVVVWWSSALSSVYQHRDCLVAVLWRERLATILT